MAIKITNKNGQTVTVAGAGKNGVTFTPHVDDNVLSWTNDGGLQNPAATEIGSSAKGVSVTLSTSWTEQTDGSFAQTVNVAGVTADNENVVDVALSGTDIDADIAVLEGWGCVNRCNQAAGTLTFYCYGDVPTVAIPLNVVVM